jgi:MFS family permease
LIAAYFPQDRLTRAVSVFTMGSPLGKTLALVAGAWLLGSVIPASGIDLGAAGSFRPWQVLFLAASLPGLVVIALLVFTLKEPARVATATLRDGRFSAAASHMLNHWVAYFFQISAACCAIILVQAFGAWSPTVFARVYGLTVSQTGYLVGCVVLVASPLGSLYGGWLTDRMRTVGVRAAPLVTIAAGLTLVMPLALAFSAAPNVVTAAALYGAITFFLSSTAGPACPACNTSRRSTIAGR